MSHEAHQLSCRVLFLIQLPTCCGNGAAVLQQSLSRAAQLQPTMTSHPAQRPRQSHLPTHQNKLGSLRSMHTCADMAPFPADHWHYQKLYIRHVRSQFYTTQPSNLSITCKHDHHLLPTALFPTRCLTVYMPCIRVTLTVPG